MDKPQLPTVKKLIHCAIIFLLSSAAWPIGLHAQNQVAKVTPTSSIYYYEYLPPDYLLNSNNYPVVFFMHGLGERGNDLASLVNVAKHGPPKYVKNGFKFPFILISPQLKTSYGDWPPWYLDEVVEYVKTQLRIDTKRIYVTGMSLGGGGAWYYAQTYPDKVAALAPICGSRNTPSKACLLANTSMPVWAFHGDKDNVVAMAKSVNMVNAINACVPAPTPPAILTIYPGVAHNAWDNAYRTDNLVHTPNVYQWMMGFSNGGVTVNSGSDITLTLPTNSTTISGTASTESGTISSYAWTKVSGPTVTLTNASTPTVSLTNMTVGVYTFRLTATNSGGESSYDEVKVTVLAAVNQAPIANAGADATITLPTNSLNLVGSGTDPDAGGSITAYSWTKLSGPTVTMGGATTSTLSLSALVQGTYVFQLTVTDNLGATDTDEVTVTVNPAAINQNPTANAGTDKTVNLPTSSTNLVGSGSDPDGSIASYLWEKLSGPTVTMTNANSATVSLSALVAGVYTFQLRVTDNQGATATDQVTVTVVAANQSPLASAGADIILTLPTSTTNITGSGSDADGTVASYAWTQVSGPNTATLANATTTTLTASNLIQGTYTFRLTVTDDDGATGFDNVLVTVNAAPVNQPPVPNAGPDITITLPTNSVTITGTATDPDGTITIYNWSKASGPAVTIVNGSTPTATFDNLVAGTYVFRFRVTDNAGAVRNDNVTVTVQPAVVNQIPTANAGADVVMTLPTNSTTLTGSGTDNDGTIASYAWTKVSGPATGTLTGQTTATLQLADLVQGTYVFQLTVTDDKGATNTDQASVTVNAANVAPTAIAGTDITLQLPTDFTDITGSGTDPDGSIASYSWALQSGPNTPGMANQNTATVSVSGLIAGTYVFTLTVTDDDGDTGTDDVKVIVNAANQTPTANAGADQSITLPTNTTNFTGSGIDADGTIASYVWTQTGGPSATLSNAATPTLTVVASTDGVYTFRLVVTDNGGASDFDDVVLTVNPAIVNQPPTADAGANQTITLPTNSLTLNGSGTDPDGVIASYQWIKVSGPSATLANDNTTTLSLNNLLEGSYVFRLTVTDNGATPLSASDEVTVTVQPAAINQPPTAGAGANQTLTLPVNSITLFGNGSDVDGSVTTYAWTLLSGPAVTITNANTPNVSLADMVEGVYDFRLTVTDDDGATGEDDVRVTVNAAATNQPPIANAGPNRTVTLPTNIANLNGTASDADGSVVRYDWVKVSGPTVTMGTTNQPVLSLSNLVEGSYVFRLEVEDDDGAIDTDDVNVTVLPAAVNQPPAVSAGTDKSIFLPTSSVLISGSASDADGSVTSYTWIQTSGPGTATLTNANTSSLTADNLIEGVYRFRLTATDDDGASTFDEVLVTVNAAAVNQPPGVTAGSDVSIQLPTNSVDLTGSAADADGTIASFAWTKVSGPTVIITNANTATVSLTNLVDGTYVFRLTVADDDGATAADQVTVTVLPASIPVAPVADAGTDQNIVLPTNTATLTGSHTDDGTIVTRLWEQLSGPANSLPADVSTASIQVSNLQEGLYIYRYTVTDDDGLSDFDDVRINVFPAPAQNAAPTVDAGEDIVLPYPQNSVSIIAVANAPEGLISSYKWTVVSTEPVVIDPDTTNILDVADLQPGNYTFRIVVTDGVGQTASDEVEVTVLGPGPDNTFSPNNDGIDDTWFISDDQMLSACEIVVYNRQGLKVFESLGYTSQWDGVFNGKPLPEGVYFYVIRCSGTKPQTGSITLIR